MVRDLPEVVFAIFNTTLLSDCPASLYLNSQALFAGALRWMSTGMCLVSVSSRHKIEIMMEKNQMLCGASTFDVKRRWTNYSVRYKWAMSPGYNEIRTMDAFRPDFRAFLKHERLVTACRQVSNPLSSVSLRSSLRSLGHWRPGARDFLLQSQRTSQRTNRSS